MGLKDHKVKSEYRSSIDNVVQIFIFHCFEKLFRIRER